MSGDSSPAPQPDPAISQAATQQADLGQQWLDFSKAQYATSQQRQSDLDALTKSYGDKALDLAQQQVDYSKGIADKESSVLDQQLQYAQEDRDRYNTTFKPIEDQFIEEATNYGSPAAQDEAAAEARADVENSAAIQQGTAERQAMGLGLRPDSGRYAGLDRAAGLGTALATAGAENTARQGVRDKGLALTGQVVDLGRNLPTMAQSETSLGLNAGNQAVGNVGTAINNQISTGNAVIGNTQQNQNLSNSAVGMVGSGYGGASTGLSSEASTLSNLYSQNLNAYNQQQANEQSGFNGLMGALGTGAGLILGAASTPWWMGSSKKIKTDKHAIPSGLARRAVDSMPVERWTYKPGVEDGGTHIGPYAEDFQKATGQGDGRGIDIRDAVGLTMRAVQDLSKEVSRLEKAAGLQPPKAIPTRAATPRKAA